MKSPCGSRFSPRSNGQPSLNSQLRPSTERARANTADKSAVVSRETLPFNTVHGGDALKHLASINSDSLFDVVIADPPYNTGRDFGNDSDKQRLSDYLQWCDQWIGACLRLVKPAAPVYIYGLPEILAHVAVRYPMAQQRWMVWHYTNKTVPGIKFWQRSHESLLCLWKGNKPVINVDLIREKYTETFLKNAAGKARKGTFCRYSQKGQETVYRAHPKGALPRDVLKVPALAGGAGYAERWFYCKTCDRLCIPKEAQAHRSHDVIRHPTQKPQSLCHRLILSGAQEGDNLLVPFAGSGAECVAAQTVKVNFYAVEINPDYVRLANAWLARQAT